LKTEVVEEKLVPMTLCPPQVPEGILWDETEFRDEMPARNRLTHGTAILYSWFQYFYPSAVI
jgi:hypothetical protein